MSNMPNAPLVYTIGVVRFPRVPAITKYLDDILEVLRSTYPQPDKIIYQIVRGNIDVERPNESFRSAR